MTKIKDTKAFYTSKTLVGALVLLTSFVVAYLDLPIPEGELASIIEGVVALVGTLLVVYGRIVAEKTFTIK